MADAGGMKLSVVIPAHNEAGSLEETVTTLSARLRVEEIPHEILIVDDHSTDASPELIARLAEADSNGRGTAWLRVRRPRRARSLYRRRRHHRDGGPV